MTPGLDARSRHLGPVSSIFQSEDEINEPWDEPSQSPLVQQTTKNGVYVDDQSEPGKVEDSWEDGDLPSLSMARMTPSLLSGKTPTTRPLNPPSKLGLDVTPKSQSRRLSKSVSLDSWGSEDEDDDAPDDELASLEMQGIQKRKLESPRRTDEYYSDREQFDDETDAKNNFCDCSSMLGDICGDRITSSSGRERLRPRKRNLRPIQDIPMDEDIGEEQVAIEIEYVEPEQKSAPDLSPSKKSSYLAALSRKAKAEFNKSKPVDTREDEAKKTASSADKTESNPEKDVYSTFTATEKRKFLKMVNSGMAPSQSAALVMEEREAAAKTVTSKRGLAFWKKPKPERSDSPENVDVNSSLKTPPQTPLSSNPMTGSSPRVNSILKKSTFEDKVVPREPIEQQFEVAGFDSDDDDDEEIESILDCAEDNSKRSATKDTKSDARNSTSQERTSSIVKSPSNPRSTESGEKIEDSLPKSGHNYYDSIRREQNDSSNQKLISPPLKVNQLRGPRVIGARDLSVTHSSPTKQIGFAQLDDKESSDVAYTAESTDPLTSSVARRDLKSGSSLRFNMKGLRNAGFSTLPAKSNKVSNDASPDSVIAYDMNLLSSSTEDLSSTNLNPLNESIDHQVGSDSNPIVDDDSVSNLFRSAEKMILESNVVSLEREQTLESEPRSPASIMSTQRGKTVELHTENSVDLQNYLDSSTKYSNSLDHMSVVSGKSHWTAATGATNFTTSSRIRRPGAAKIRLAKAKEAEKAAKSRKGWHESIKNAAARSNQKWDPKEGFLNYQEPDVITRGVVSDEVIHIELKGLKKRRQSRDNVPGDIDFTSKASDTSPKTPYHHHVESESQPVLISPLLLENVQVSDDLDTSTKSPQYGSSNDQGNINSILQVMSTLPEDTSEENMVWEEEYGEEDEEEEPHLIESESEDEYNLRYRAENIDTSFPRITNRDAKVKEKNDQSRDIFSIDSPQSNADQKLVIEKIVSTIPGNASVVREIEEKENVRTVTPEVKYNTSELQRLTGGSPKQKKVAPDPEGLSSAEAIRQNHLASSRAILDDDSANETSEHVNELGAQVNKKEFEHSLLVLTETTTSEDWEPPRAPSQASQSLGDGDTITTAQDEKYVQIGDTGSVKSFAYNQSPSDTPRERSPDSKQNDGPFTSDGSRSTLFQQEPSFEDDKAPLLSANDLVKSTIRSESIMVVKEKSTQDDVKLFADDSRNSAQKSMNDVIVHNSTRRSQGPIDIDEIDDMDFDSEDNQSDAWADEQIGRSESRKDQIEDNEMKSVKHVFQEIPRIKPSDRDTSPMRTRKRMMKVREHASAPQITLSGMEEKDSFMPTNAELQPQISTGDKFPGITGEDENLQAQRINRDKAIPIAFDDGRSRVKNLAKQWESRVMVSHTKVSRSELDQMLHQEPSPHMGVTRDISESPNQQLTGTAGWKSFLEKKVIAESAAAAKQEVVNPSQRMDLPPANIDERSYDVGEQSSEQDEDSLFEFKLSMRGENGAFPTIANSMPGIVDDSFSDISPIQTQGEEYYEGDHDRTQSMESVSDTGTNVEQGTFFKRLQACAAPIMPRQFLPSSDLMDSLPAAHLAFLRGTSQRKTQNSTSLYSPHGFCGSSDDVKDDGKSNLASSATERGSSSSKRGKARTSPKQISETVSPISDAGFGAKTSYLEAMEMEAAVSKPKRHGSRGRGTDDRSRTSSMSDASSGLKKNEKWKEFLDRKSAGISPGKDRSVSDHSSEVSKAAEKFAAQQVEEMMKLMAMKKEDVSLKQVEELMSSVPMSPNAGQGVRLVGSASKEPLRSVQKKSETARAAEELAAARVEAMMAAMTSQSLDEGEI
jgi:hypothetical protein